MQNELTIRDKTSTTPRLVRLPLGQIVATPGALETLEEAGQLPQEFISRYARLEQGELTNEDYRENLFSVNKSLRIFSAYKTARGVKLWVITEANRSATTILLPEEY